MYMCYGRSHETNDSQGGGRKVELEHNAGWWLIRCVMLSYHIKQRMSRVEIPTNKGGGEGGGD